jgi:hypothetical protein
MAYPQENLGCDLLLDSTGDLMVGTGGDLVLTPNGRVCLLQDVANLLETLPGDLFSHPTFGAGLPRLLGEEDRPEFEALAGRAISDALTFDGSVGPRLEPESIEVKVTRLAEGDPQRVARISVSFQALGETWTCRLNLVWGLGQEVMK